MKNVAVIGLWHLGSVTSACLSKLGYNVIGYDSDESRIINLNKGIPPISEPRLEDLIKKNIEEKHLLFTNSLSEALKNSEFILLTIDTPVDEKDRVNLDPIFSIMKDIIKDVRNDVCIIIQSQIPVGTCDKFLKNIEKIRPKSHIEISYCPENLRLGNAIEIFERPDRIIIGANNEKTANKVKSFFDVIDCPKILMDLKSAEMTKHSINAFLATCISFINWIGNVCEEVGADSSKVSEGLLSEKRIGSKLPLKSGLGFSGGTLGRDLNILSELGKKFQIGNELINSVISTNHEQNIRVIKKLMKIFDSLDGLQIGILGLTYKPGTDTLRRSIALEIINELLKLNANVLAFDPAIKSVESISNKKFQLCDSALSAAQDSNALLIMTDWPEFKTLDYEKMFSVMKRPLILDMKNFLNKELLQKIGFKYLGIGKPNNS